MIAGLGLPLGGYSAERDDPPPYVVYRGTDSRPSAATGFGARAREYEYTIIAIARDPDEVQTMREAVDAAFDGCVLTVAGWGTSQRVTWQGEVTDPGELLPGGSIGHEAGDRYKITIARSTT